MPHARPGEAVLCESAAAATLEPSIQALSLWQVIELTNLSKGHIYALIARGKFPAPAKIGRKSIWSKREVELWLKARFAERVTLVTSDAAPGRRRKNAQRSFA